MVSDVTTNSTNFWAHFDKKVSEVKTFSTLAVMAAVILTILVNRGFRKKRILSNFNLVFQSCII